MEQSAEIQIFSMGNISESDWHCFAVVIFCEKTDKMKNNVTKSGRKA